LLPTLSFSPGDQSFDCRISTRTVVLDLSGTTAIEDASDVPYVFADGTELLFYGPTSSASATTSGRASSRSRRRRRSTASRSAARR